MQYQAHIPMGLTQKFIDKLGYEPENKRILTIRDFFTAMTLAVKNAVVFVTDDPEARDMFKNIVMFNPEFGSDDEVIYIDVENNKNAWKEFIEELPNMPKFDICISNPPFEFGNKIFNVLKDKCETSVVIMPLNQYKCKELFKHIEQFELADPKVFDAVITENLNISVVKSNPVNKFDWKTLLFESCEIRFRKFYEWNIAHNRNIVMKTVAYKPLTYFNSTTDFIETSRSFSIDSGSGFGAKGLGYQWNVLNNYTKLPAEVGIIRFNNQKEVKNLAKFWYNGKKGCSLCSKLILGVHAVHASAEYYFTIPQIDWETIDQHPLWNTDVDAAVLDTMGLKWDDNKEFIILK